MVLEKTLENPLDYKEIQPVHLKGNQSWIFIGRTDAEAETPILWPPDAKNWLIGKDPDPGKDWWQEEKGTTEDEMVGWYYQLQCTWVWVGSKSWWWIERSGMLQSMGSQTDMTAQLNSSKNRFMTLDKYLHLSFPIWTMGAWFPESQGWCKN